MDPNANAQFTLKPLEPHHENYIIDFIRYVRILLIINFKFNIYYVLIFVFVCEL